MDSELGGVCPNSPVFERSLLQIGDQFAANTVANLSSLFAEDELSLTANCCTPTNRSSPADQSRRSGTAHISLD